MYTKLKFPKGERIFVSYHNVEDELLFVMTAKEPAREYYCLYEVNDGTLKKLGRAHSPIELEDKFSVDDRIGVIR